MVEIIKTEFGEIRMLDQAEGLDLLDWAAHYYLQMNADDFIKKWKAGEFNNPDQSSEVMTMIMLLPFANID